MGEFRQNLGELSPLVWAYVGDAVFELAVRSFLVEQGLVKLDKLHGQTISWVKATAQAQFLQQLETVLSAAEKDIVRRGRNAKSCVPRNVKLKEYRLSTGFEALWGYLFLDGQKARLRELMTILISRNEGID